MALGVGLGGVPLPFFGALFDVSSPVAERVKLGIGGGLVGVVVGGVLGLTEGLLLALPLAALLGLFEDRS